ncbi:hypothetical protein LTR91_000231 [Friedmanniomyces endolithicus]|uniref:Uncharacterized protein n=1 Tax=Friedmanniomyces endolithicus TaxID=329885 RepID=A0AAN6L5W4_9PEZI|nr:hypothetical protein LTR35_007550 [Friedmanniomyces endolithicus]KAK0295138.1 hypothetical protein LTS00_006194 [Friedmanniomyces endolithicus]KAK0317306.1 hypothetical protein LTR82_011629 [Friedmanniomyces endolithicus]KAK0931282.1 hypothetical protein LTR57_000697 [Friedmanniomyces endolithicus]KAK1010431.1 hypothetical protein LTR54_005386 [Friedmanniomyces endolithicus]
MSTLSDGESHEAHSEASAAAESVSTINSGDDDVEIRPISFYSLPAEVRVQIYDYFFADINTRYLRRGEKLESGVGDVLSFSRSPTETKLGFALIRECDLFPGLMRASACIRIEATPQYCEILDRAAADLYSHIATAEAFDRKLKALGSKLEASTAEWQAGIGRAILVIMAMGPSRSLEVKLERVEAVLWSLLEPKGVLTVSESIRQCRQAWLGQLQHRLRS